ncbi:hypothetical protein GA0061081_101337 [Gilliamella bombicola]|uniref:Lipoprotein n=1 Tax=Gilliamella bombicola TaxID=1798182 RepID=A0A1C3ZCJ7_9GAMM|nr:MULTISPECIES: hypothetical protein [Gilliamella]NUF27695.1 hypothetical protein [Gilliamella sp. ESL0254]SCB79982.1 hypothetical protein GA0061081_101337 [Gilliamella bombicola]
MKKLIGYFAVLTILTSCASQKMMSIYHTEGVEITKDSSGIDILNKFSTSRPITILHSSLSLCIAQELDNSPVVLSSENYLGAQWWPYWNMPTQQAITVNGGDTIKLVEGNHVVANAIVDYQYHAKYFVSYTLTATRNQHDISYLFSNIKQAQQYTGSVVNDGFENVKTLERYHPNLVIEALNNEVSKIQECLLRQ